MNEAQAVKRYIEVSKLRQKVIKRLMDWDETKTIREMSEIYKDTITATKNFQLRYRLRYFRHNHIGRRFKSLEERNKKIVTLRNLGFNYQEIGELYDMSRQNIEHIVRKG